MRAGPTPAPHKATHPLHVSPAVPRHGRLQSWKRAVSSVVLLLVSSMLVAAPALAVLAGKYPTKPKTWRVYGKAVQLGASLVTNFTDYRYNDKLLNQSSDSVQNFETLPTDAVIKAAYLFWGGSANGPIGGESADNTASLRLADGFLTTVTADSCDLESPPGLTAQAGKHFYCRRDITSLLSAHPGTNTYNGTYTVGAVNAKVASITSNCGGLTKPNQVDAQCVNKPETTCCAPGDAYCQARHASWSLVIIYDTKFSETTQRDIFLWDGFKLIDERRTSKGEFSLKIENFDIGDPPQAELMYYSLEGDSHLGEPYQSSGGCDSAPCGTCYDYISFNGTKLTGGAGNNDANNIFNSTPETGVDLDQFNVSNLVKPKDTQANIIIGSGDGNLANNPSGAAGAHGYGELILYGYTVMQVNRLAPNYKNPITKYTVNASEAAPGEVLTYTVDLLNNGQLDASPTTLKLNAFPPPGTEYVPGTTLVEGKTVPDVGGSSAILSGLNLGNITAPAGGKSSRKVSFKVKVKSNPGVATITSNGVLSYQYKGTVSTFNDSVETNATEVKITAPKLATPLLIATTKQVSPGGTTTWQLTLENASANNLVVDSVRMDTPKEANFVSTTIPAGATNLSSTTGGANKTGFLRLEKVAIAAGKQVVITITGKLKSINELTALGINPLNGHSVQVQGAVNLGTKTYSTDDPSVPGANNPTQLFVLATANLNQSSKEGLDLSPATPLSPGDEMQFSISIVNQGPGDATVNILDALPTALEYISSPDVELSFSGGAVLASNVAIKAGQSRSFTFKTRVKASVQPGTQFSNSATLSPTDGSPPKLVQTGTFTVTGGPTLTTSTKTVVDVNGGDLEPGDVLRYTILLVNSGKQPSGALQVSDPISSVLDNVGNVTSGGVYNLATNTVTWAVPSLLPNGGKRVLTFEARIKPGTLNGTEVSNIATISGAELKDSVPVAVTVKVQAPPNVSTFSWAVTSSQGGAFVPGETVTYTLRLRNTGKGAVSKLVLTAPFDSDIALATASDNGVIQGQQVQWNIGSLPAGGPEIVRTVTGTLAALIPQGKVFQSQVKLSGDGLSTELLSDDPDKSGSGDVTEFPITSAPIMTLTKAFVDLNGGVVQGGDIIEFRVSAKNSGNAPASKIVLTDVVQKDLINVQVTNGAYDGASKTVTWNAISDLVPTDPLVTLTFRATVDPKTATKTKISNQAGATFTETPNSVASNTVSFEIENLPDFAASTKQVSGATIPAGDSVTFTINVQNTGNLVGTEVVITDVLPKELSDIKVAGGTYNAGTNTATWTVASLNPGQKQTITVSGTVTTPLADGTKICNQATISAKNTSVVTKTSPPGTQPTPAGEPTCFVASSAASVDVLKDVFNATTGAKLNGGIVKPNTALRYELRVRNSGNDVAQQVRVTDVVPALLTDVVALDGGSYNATTGTLSWPVIPTLNIGDGQAQLRRFTAKVKPALDDGLAIDNQAEVVWQGAAAPVKSDDPTTPAVRDATRVTVLSKVDLSDATKKVVDNNGGDVTPGDTLTWTITFSNAGDSIARDVQIVDPIDNRLDNVQVTDGGLFAGGVITWKLPDMVPGASATVSYTTQVKIPQINGAEIPNQAQITAKGFSTPVLTDSDGSTAQREPTSVTVKATSDLSGSAWSFADDNGGTVEPGDQLTFTLSLKNSGDALATNTAIKALLSSTQLTTVKPFDGGTFANDTVDWTVPLISLSPAGDVQLRFTARVKEGLTNGAKITVSAVIPGLQPAPQIVVTVDAKPRLETSLVAADDETGWLLKVGQTGAGHSVRVEITAANTGKVAATQVQISLPIGGLLEGITFVTPGTVANGVARWTLPSLAAGGTAKFVLRGKVKASISDGTTFTPTATLKPVELANGVVISGPQLTVLKRPVLKVSKTVEDTTGKQLFPGDVLRYSVTVANVGNAAATELVISDDLNSVALTDVQVGAGGSLKDKVAIWSIASLAAGQIVTVTLEGKVGLGVPAGGKLVNIATAKATQGAGASSNKTEITVDYPTLAVEAIYLPKAPAVAPLRPGDEVTLRAVVKAGGTYPATNTRVLIPVDTSLFEVVEAGGGTFDTSSKFVVFEPSKVTTLKTLAPNEELALNVVLRVKATAANDSTASSIITAREGQTKLPYNSKPATVKILSIPELTVVKEVEDLDGGKVEPLDRLRYTITVGIKGKAAAYNLVLSDTLPTNLEVVAVGQGGKLEGNKLTWDGSNVAALKLLAPGDTVKLEVDVRVAAGVVDGDEISNQAFASADAMLSAEASDDPATPTPSDPTVLTVRVATALGQSTKSVVDENGAPLLVGDIVTWRLNVIATYKQALAGVKIWDPIPAGMVYIPGSTRLGGVVVDDVQGVSPIVTGMLVNSPGQLPGVLAPGVSDAAVVTFKTRVRNDVLDGTLISNVATAAAQGVPPTPIGPAQLTVGKGPSLQRFQKTAQLLDTNGDGVADIGEELLYVLVVDNSGASEAKNVVLTDVVPKGGLYVPSSIAVDGKKLTDADDGDAARFDPKTETVKVTLGTLAASAKREVSFRVRISAGGVLSNQALVTADGVADEPSDVDGDDSNGNQPTVTPVKGTTPKLQVAKVVQDENGGEVEAGDALRYTVYLINSGTQKVLDAAVLDDLPIGLESEVKDVLLPTGAKWSFGKGEGFGPGVLRITNLNVEHGESVALTFRVRVVKNAADGLSICNVVRSQQLSRGGDGGRQPIENTSKPACVTVGAMGGQGVVQGFVFEDIGLPDGVFQPKVDATFAGWQVIVSPPDGTEGASVSAVTSADGSYRLKQVPAGRRRVQVRSPGGAVFLDGNFDATTGAALRLDLALKPTGRLYDARTAELIAGIRVFLYYDATDAIAPNTLVDASDLPEGQQGQRVDGSGAYIFTPKQGRAYRYSVSAGGQPWAFPSTRRAPEPDVALLSDGGFVVQEALPARGQPPRYFTRFTLQGGTGKTDDAGGRPTPRHNHLPLDALSDAIKITLHLSKARAMVGEVVHGTVVLENTSNSAIAANPLTGQGGGILRGLMPEGLSYVAASLRMKLRQAGATAEISIDAASAQGPVLEVRRKHPGSGAAVGLDLPPGARLTVRFQAVVSVRAKIGATMSARAQLFDTGGGALTKRAAAKLLVQADPLLDHGTLLGKVFCDTNGNGWQDAGELGLGAARVYVDTGHYSDSDAHGRFHLMDIPPGNHLFKLDVQTLPPGSKMTTDVKRVLWVSRGVGLKLRFGVKCGLEQVRPSTVRLKITPEKKRPLPPKGAGVVHVRGSTADLSVQIDDRTLPQHSVRAALIPVTTKTPTALPVAVTPVLWAAGAPLRLVTTIRGAFSVHRVDVREIKGDGELGTMVFGQRYRGPPRPLLVLPLPTGTLVAGRRYAVRVKASTRYGAGAWSIWVPFEIARAQGPKPALTWQVTPPGRRVQVNGVPVSLRDDGKFDTWVKRPTSGRLLVSVRRRRGEGRNAYVTIAANLSKRRVRVPVVSMLDKASIVTAQPAAATEAPPRDASQKSSIRPTTAKPTPAVAKPTPAVAKPTPAVAKPTPAVAKPTPAVAKLTPAITKATPPTARPPAVKPSAASAVGAVVVPATKPAVAKPVATVAAATPAAAKRAAAGGPTFASHRMVPISFERTSGVVIAGSELRPRTGKLSVQVPSGPLPLIEGVLASQVVVRVGGLPKRATRAAMVLLDTEGAVRVRTPLSTPLPETFVWDPNASSYKALRPGVYGVALEVMVKGRVGEIGWRSAPTKVELSGSSLSLIPAGAPDKVVRATLFDPAGRPTHSMKGWIDRAAATVRGRSDRMAVVTVHSVAKDATGRTKAAARDIARRMRSAGVSRTKLLVLAAGSRIPDSDPQGTNLGPDRVEVRFRSLRVAGARSGGRFSLPAGLWIDGAPVLGEADGSPPRKVRVRNGKPTRIEQQMSDGRAALWLRVFGGKPGGAKRKAAPQLADSSLSSFGSELIAELAAELDADDAAKKSKKSKKGAGKNRRTTTATANVKAKKAKVADAATPKARLKTGKTAKAASTKASAKAEKGLKKAPTREVSVDEAGDVAAAQLEVTLPPAGRPLTSQLLSIRGRTAATNKVSINGREVSVAADGSFHHLLKLPIGKSTLLVESLDEAGHTAVLKREVEVAKRTFFLMAMADTAVAQLGGRVQGMTDKTTVRVGDVLLHGRGAVYLKGRIQGKYLGFKKIRYTAHLDTAKNADAEDFRSNLFDPDRFYPVYGDGTTDVQDAQARGMLYVLVEADRSKLLLGNFRSGVHGFELLRYDRAMYGAYLEVNRVFAGKFDTHVKVFASQEDRQLSRRTDYLRGTGGSLYYTSNRDVLDGSEKVWLVVRDRDSNTELARIPQTRNSDYNIDYREGRVVFKAPVNSAVDSFFAIGQAGQPGQHLAWNGHPVFVQVTYESRSPGATTGANIGAQVTEKLMKGRVTLGGSYVQESRSSASAATYRLAGAHAEVKMGKHSRLRAEYAYSQSRDSLVSVSDDGGLSFGQGVGSSGGHLDSAVRGHALSVNLDADLRDLGKLLGFKPKAAGKDGKGAAKFGHVKAYYKLVQAGFHSNGVLTEQGQQKLGLDSQFALRPDNTLSIRYDGILTGARRDPFQTAAPNSAWGTGSLATSGSFAPVARQMITLQDNHRMGRLTLVGATHYMYGRDISGVGRHSQTFAAGGSFRVSSRLNLRAEQQLILGGDPNQYQSRVLDHFTTVIGADWKLTDNISLTASERLGWGGQNATMAGLRTKLSKDSSLYLQQRLEDSYQTGRAMSATVIGAESRYGKDKLSRAYGEYQVDALNAGRMNRATMGLGKRFVFSPGLHLDAGYERSQTFSGPSGSLSRDTFSFGGEWLQSKRFKLTSRQEVRVDSGDEDRGGERKVQVVSLNAITLKATRDIELFGRANYLRTQNQTRDRLDAETLQATTGAAWRPVAHNWVSILGKYTHLIEKRPSGLDNRLGGGVSERGIKHIFSVEPVIETPWNLQIAHKFAWRRASERMADSPLAVSDTWLVISRLGYHMGSMVDLAAEYRLLRTSLSGESEHGALIEAAYILAKTLRIGGGYNFTHFVQTSAGDIVRDQGGFFLRVIGMY